MTTQAISSITTGPRQSNFELLRILAMFLVLVVHADFWAIGAPNYEDFISTPLNAWTRTIIESAAIVCVNVFILISGWFGIKPSFKGLANFLFQCAYFLFGIYLIMLITGRSTLTIRAIAECFSITPINWFIKSYIGLYIVSPILNAFIDKASRLQFTGTLIAFYVFQTIWGWSGAAKYFEQGYSAFSFMGLYLLSRYVKLFVNQDVSKWGGVIYLICILLNSVLLYATTRWHLSIVDFSYINPLIVIGALGLLMFFTRTRIKIGVNRHINYIGASAFAVFLIHTNPNVGSPIFKPFIYQLYSYFDGILCLVVIFTALVLIFALAILVDQPRKWLWKQIVKIYFK